MYSFLNKIYIVYIFFFLILDQSGEVTTSGCEPKYTNNYRSNNYNKFNNINNQVSQFYHHPSVDLTIFLDANWEFDKIQNVLV